MQKFLRTLTLMALLVVPWVTQAQQTLPYSYGFEDNDLSVDGWLLQNATSTSTGISSNALQTGSYGFLFEYSESNGATLISPVLTGTTNGVTVSFSYKEYSNSYGDEQFYVGYTTDETVTSPSDFTYGEIITASLSWQQYENTFPAGTKRIAIKYVYNDAFYLYLDDFTFEAPSSCVKPSAINITGATASSISISWTPAGSETSWNVYLNGVQQNTTPVTTTSYTFNGLSLGDYTIGVTAICGSDESAPKNITHHLGYCLPAPTSVDGSGISNVTFGSSLIVNDNLSMSSSPYYYDHSSQVGDVFPGGTVNMSINYVTNYAYYTWVWVDWNNDFTFSESEKVYAATSTISSGILELSFEVPNNTPLSDYRMRIMGKDGTTNDPCYTGTYAYLVDYTLRVSTPPSCMPVTALTGTASGTTVTLTWTDENNTGATYIVKEGENVLSSNATSPYVINGVTLGDHTYSVMVDCGSSTANPVSTNVHVGYCVPSPSNVDGTGITSVSFGGMTNTTHLGSTAGYADYSGMAGSVPASTTASVEIAYGHQYDYGTIIWVDWNNDMTFSGDEVVFAGQSPGGSASTNYFTATFEIPATQAVGNYRMRILGADGYFDSYTGSLSAAANANPCATGYSYGVAEDYTLTVTEAPSCMPVSNLAYGNLTASGVTLSWTDPNSGSNTYVVKIGDDVLNATTTPAVTFNGTTATITGLTALTSYTFSVAVDCGSATSPASNVSVTTPCAAEAFPFTEDFSATLASDPCWRGATGTTADQVFAGATLTLGNNNAWTYSSSVSNGLEAGHYRANIYGTSCKKWIITPNIDLTTATSAQLSFDAAFTAYNGTAVASGFASNSSQAFMVLVSTDGGATWPEANATKWQNEGGQHTLAELASTEYIQQIINLDQYVGQTIRIAFYAQSTTTGGDNNIHIDNIAVTIPPTCYQPTAFTYDNLTTNSATLTWTRDTRNADGETYSILDVNDQVVPGAENISGTSYQLTGLTQNTEYTFKVRTNCANPSETVDVLTVSFTTLADCAAPVLDANGISGITAHTADVDWTGFTSNDSYTVSYRTAAYFDGISEGFGTTSIPSGWTRSNTLLTEDVLNGTTQINSYSGGWTFVTSGNGVFDGHTRVNIYGTSAKYWLITPATEVGEGYGLSFDMALTKYSGTLQPVDPAQQLDDKFVVLISNDDKATWSILRQWDNAGSAYVYNDITCSATGENVTIDLGGFAGQTVYVAFYGESTLSGGDNNLHIDNVGIGQMVPAGAWQTISTTNTSTTLTGLAGETIYDVKVSGTCGSNVSDESETLQFTTEIACPATTDLVAGVPTPNSVELSWTENGTATAWQLCINGDDVNLVAANANPFTLTGLDASTDYTVKVRANCGGIDGQSDWSNTVSFTTQANCPVPVLEANGISNVTAHTADIDWTGFTQNDSYNVFYRSQEYVDGISEEFATTTIPEGWTLYTGLLSNIMSGTALTSATSGWTFGTGNNVFNSHARVNIYGNYQRWLVTPNIAVGDNFGFNFDMALTVYTSTSSASPTPGNQPDDKFVVLISTDNMTTWSILRQWDNEGSPYVYDEIPNTGENVSIDLSAYAGQNVKIAFYGESTVSNGDNNLHIDNVTIGVTIPAGAWQTVSTNTASTTLTGLAAETPHEVKIQGVCGGEPTEEMSDVQVFTTLPSCMMVEGLAINPDLTTSSSLTITWNDNYNNGATYTIYMNGVVAAPAVTGNSYTATDLESNSPYSFAVVANCGDVDGLSAMTATVTGRTNCDALTLPHTFTFEADELITTSNSAATPALPWCSQRYVTPGATSYATYPYSYTSYPHDGSRALYFYGTTVTAAPAQMAWITPQVDVTTFPMNGNRVTFWARMANTTNNKDVIVGTMSDPNDFTTFTEAGSVTVSGTTHTEYAVNLNTATATDAYIAIVVNKGSGHLYMDDVTLELIPSCLAVTDLTASDVTTTSVVLNWTDTENENASYTVMNGTEVVKSGITTTTDTVTNLTPNTDYTFAVVANCAVDAEPVTVNVHTLCEAATLPFDENFEENSETVNCWDYVSNNTANIGGNNGMGFVTLNGKRMWRFSSYSNASDYNQYAYSQPLSVEAGAQYLEYYVRYATYGSSDHLWFGYIDANDNEVWSDDYYTTSGQSNFQEYRGVIPATAKKVAIHYYGSFAYYAWIDSVNVKVKNVFEPTDLVASNISNNSVTLTWTRDTRNNGAETYTITNGTEIVATGINANNYVATIEPNTDYNFRLFATMNNESSDAVSVDLGVYEFPTEPGKMVAVSGTILNNYNENTTVTLYRGLGDNLTEQSSYTSSTYLTSNLTNYTTSNDWPNVGPMTVIFVGEDATGANTGVANLTASKVCPYYVETPATLVETANGAYTWTTPQGVVYNYENHRNADLAVNENGSIVATYTDTVRNAGDCDSIINTLQLTLHPDFTINVTDQFCEGTTYTVGEGTADEVVFTASAQQNVLLHTVNGADSVIVLDLQMNPSPVAYINNKANDVVNNFCDEFDLVLNARSNMEGVTFQWDDLSTAATRTVNPHESNTYTLIAIDPTTGCQSVQPATLTVNTTPVPALSIVASADAICYGQSVTLTVNDANNVNATYRWSNNQTGNSITVSPTETTIFTVTATSEIGNCVVTAEKTVTVNPLPVVTVSTDASALCANSTLTLTATEVEGYNYQWNNGAATAVATTNPTVSGAYTVTVSDQNGCVNEFTTANVTVYPVYEVNAERSACQEMLPITWGTQTIDAAGIYNQTFQTVNGCDSIVHLTFSIDAMPTENSYAEYCEGATFTFGGQEYTASSTLAQVSYIDNSNTCPVNMVQHLTIHPVKATTVPMTVCDSYVWNLNNETYTTSGDYNHTLATVHGCDSVVTLALTVNYQNTGIDAQTACDQFVWDLNGQTYTASTNEPVVTLNNANAFGCDSVVTLNLTVNYKSFYTDVVRECNNTTYTWIDGETYNLSVSPADNVTYTLDVDNAAGCDSIAILDLTMNYVLDTLNWVNVTSCDNYYIDVVTCEGDIVREYISESGDVIRRTRNAETGRDRMSRIHLTINNSDHQTIPVTACVPYDWQVTENLVIAGINPVDNDTVISQELQTEFGCNLIKVLRLHALRATENVTPVTLCQNGSWTDGNDVTYQMADYQIGVNHSVQWNQTTNVAGCDSTDYVVFTVNPVYNVTGELTYCENEFINNALTFANPNNAAETIELTIPGDLNQQVYTNTVVANWTTAAGCDSIVTISYTVNPSLFEDVTVQNCYTYEWNGQMFTTLGESTAIFETTSRQYGCDSTATLYLTLTDTVKSYETIEACGEYEFNGVLYRESKTFEQYAGHAVSGCDSVHYTTYHVTPRVMRDHYVTTNIPYTWHNGVTYTSSANNIYYDATLPGGCDSILVLHLTMLEDTAIVCENQAPYTIAEGITVDYIYNQVVPFDQNDIYAYTNLGYGDLTTFYWKTDFTAGMHDGATKLYGANLYTYDGYMPEDGIYNMNVVVNGNNVATKSYVINEPGFHNLLLDTPIDVTNGDNVSIFFSAFAYYPCFTARLNNPISNCTWSIDGNDWYTWSDGAWYFSALFNKEDGMDYGYVYSAGADMQDTIIYYVVKHNSNEEILQTSCDSYTWTNGDGMTYTESGNHVYDVVGGSVNGCDSTATLVLTVNYHTGTNVNVTTCDSYIWTDGDGETYNQSGTYYNNTINAAGCENIDTLNLTINVNPGVEETVAACNSYVWNGQTLTTSNHYTVQFTDANGCLADSVLHLTINTTTENDITVVRNEASTYYNGNYYPAQNYQGANPDQPYQFDVIHDETDANGCQIIDHVTLYVTRGIVSDETVNECDEYTWARNNHTYVWIPASERQANGNALYKDATDNVYIHTGENPTAMDLDANGIATNTYVLWLNMTEANHFTVDLGDVMLSDNTSLTVGNDTLGYATIDLTQYIADKQNATLNEVIDFNGSWYCKNEVTYTANLIYNYDTVTPVTVCDVTSWTDPVNGVHTVNIGDTNGIDYVTADNWHHHVVVNVTARTASAPQVEEACDTYTWTAGNGQTYTASTTANWNDDVNCTVETLQLTINTNAGSTESATECDTYTWNAPDGQNYTYTEGGVKTVQFTDANGCVGTATLNLTINTNAGIVIPDVVSCDSYTWDAPNGQTYVLTETQDKVINFNDANGCEGTATLELTINTNPGIEETVAECNGYTWTYQSLNELNGLMEDVTHTYIGSAESGDKSFTFMDINGCEGTATLHLTIYDPQVFTREQYAYGNGITINGQFYEAAENGVADYTVVLDTTDANGCATTVTISLHVSQYEYFYTNKVACGSYTWTAADNGNGHTYRIMTDAEATANPTAIYFDATDNVPVTTMPQFTTGNRIDVLNLTLNEPSVTVIAASIPLSQLAASGYVYTTVDGTIDCSEAATATANTTVTAEFSMGPHAACDSIVRYNVNVIYNYFTDAPVTLCAQTTYEVVAGDVRTISLGVNTLQYTLNAGAANEEVHTVVVTNNDYAPATPQVVEVCDTYTWTAGNGQTYTASTTVNWNNDATCTAETLQLTINTNAGSTETATECDTYTWNAPDGEAYTYTEGGVKTVLFTDANGCVGTATLNLTINTNAGTTETETACDSYTWQYMPAPLTESDTYTVNYTDANGCEGVHTLNLTINAHQDAEFSDAACVTYTWADNNDAVYTTSGDYTRPIMDANNCPATETLHLTINQPESEDVEFWFGEGSYRYTGIYTSATGHLYGVGDYNVTETVANATANGCDSIYNITLHVGNNYAQTEAVRACDTYTWARNNVTYARLTEAQSAQYPTALYFDQTNNEPVYYNPVVVEPRVNDFADEYMLDLTLDAIIQTDVTVDFPVSQGVYTFAGQSYGPFITNDDEGRLFAGQTVTDEIHLAAAQYCDSIINLTINVVNNYDSVGTDDVCYTETSYTWEGNTIALPADADNLNTLYVYNTVGDRVQYMVVNQHPIQYVTERRTECDSYEWRGVTYTESTSGVVRNFTDQYGCDSTVTLVLTINHNSSSVFGSETAPVQSCDSYKWTLTNGEIVQTMYTESGVYTMDYTSVEGCPSTDVLYLTINSSDAVEVSETACDSYTWETVGTYTTSNAYTHTFTNAAGCDSVVTLNLTINNSSATVYDGPVSACDSYEWHGMTWNGTEMVDTLFGTYTTGGASLTATAYNEYGCPIPHFISLMTISQSNARAEVTACDSYTWHGETYTESGAYEYVSTTTDACGNFTDSLYLTINYNTNHADVVAICNNNLPAAGYEWNGGYYSTTGEYTYDYTTANGCPSTDTLKLTIGNIRTYARVYVENCGSYTWDVSGETFDESTEASYIMPAANSVGCDSVIYLYLTVTDQTVINETDVVCDSELPYTWHGQNLTATGTYTDRGELIASGLCDTLFTMNLTVNERTYSNVNTVACDSYDWNGVTYTTSGVYTYTTTNAAGCDNIDTLHLTINNNSGHATSVAACDNYTWNGETYNVTGTYYYNYNDANNCASVDTLNLVIANSVVNNFVAIACDSYTWTAVNGDEVGTYTTSGVYTYNYSTIDGCNGTETLTLTVNYSTDATVNEVACDSYDWYGTTYTESGVYTHTITNVSNCDSVITLNLTVNNSTEGDVNAAACNYYTWADGNGMTYFLTGDYSMTTLNAAGCDSTVTLHLTINTPVYTTIDTATCGVFTWYGRNYEANDVIVTTFTAANGCDSIETVNFTYKAIAESVVAESACDSYTWDANGETYTTSGNYSAVISAGAANGCDSVINLALTVNYNSNSNYVETACDNYEWNGTTYTASGVYAYEYNTADGCASVDSLFLTVNNSVASSFSDEACNYYLWNNLGYNQSGVYTQTFTAANGCDSVVTLNLTINTQVSSDFSAEACNSYTWNGSTYTATGAYVQHFSSVAGCDSVVTLNLTIKNGVQNTISTSVCNSYTWNDQTYTAPGTYTQSFTAANGCDSIVTLNLSFYSAVENNINVSACDSYTWNNQTYTTSGVYTQGFSAVNGCDSIVTMNLTINHNGGSYTSLAVCNGYTWNNTTYNASGIYTHVSNDVNGCSGIDTLNLTILQPTSSSTFVSACVSYTWNGNTYVASGSYIYTTVAANGCDSVATLNLTINQPTSSSTFVSACNSYIWNGNTYNTSGSYTYNTVAANGCDSVATLNLTINQPKYSSVTVTACNSYIWNGNTYVASGDYTHNTVAYDGCDSIVTLHLTINQSTSSIVEVTTCGSFTWIDGQYYTASTTTPTVTLVNANGCDSVVTLHLTINQPLTGDAYATACSSYTWEGTTYTVSGNYTHTYTAANGCDSVVTLHLTINQPVASSITATACSSYTWGDATYTTSGDYTRTYTAANGCDSVVTLHLTINQPVATSFAQTACVSYTWEGTTYTTSGNYTHTYTAANGCDSVVTMMLTINQPVSSTIYATACDSYTWDGNTYVVSGTYTQTYTAANNCDSVVTLVLTINNSVSTIDEVSECDGFIWIDNVNYTESTNTPTVVLRNYNGCDSIVTLHLTINHSVEVYDSIEIYENQLPYNYNGNIIEVEGDYMISGTTVNGCDSTVYLHVGVIAVQAINVVSDLENITVYPNPTHGQSTITADDVETIEVYDIVGHLVAKFENTNHIDITNLAEGTYTLRIITTNGTAVRRLVKK